MQSPSDVSSPLDSQEVLQSFYFRWRDHPHRLRLLDVDRFNGLKVLGGPWTDGSRKQDYPISRTNWNTIPVSFEEHAVTLQTQAQTKPADTDSVVSLSWELPVSDVGENVSPIALIKGFSLETKNRPTGINPNHFAITTQINEKSKNKSVTITMEIGAGKVPERREKYQSFSITGSVSIVLVYPSIKSVESMSVGETRQLKLGVNPTHAPSSFRLPSATDASVVPLGISSFRFETSKNGGAPGRYIREFGIDLTTQSLQMWFSNSGPITRPTTLTTAATVVFLAR